VCVCVCVCVVCVCVCVCVCFQVAGKWVFLQVRVCVCVFLKKENVVNPSIYSLRFTEFLQMCSEITKLSKVWI
jgi:hypothetical protein